MRKVALLFLGLFLTLPSYAANIHTACVAVDEVSGCDCKARNGVSNSPRDEKKYATCLAEIEKTGNSPEHKQKLLEEKQKELEAKQAELEKKQAELETKSEAKAEAKVEVKAEAKTPMSEEETKAYIELGDKAKILESLVPIFEKKDKATQDRVRALVGGFKLSNDNYTKNIGFYLSYLLG